MRLRPRLLMTVLLTAAPLLVGLLWLVSDLQRQAIVEGLRSGIVARMEHGGRELCEAAPAEFGGPEPEGFDRRGPRRPRSLSLSGRDARADAGDTARNPRLPSPDTRRDLGQRPRFEPRPGPLPRRRDERPRPPLETWAYDATFTSANPSAPPFPANLRATLAMGDDTAWHVDDSGDQPVVTVAARMTWDEGPCAIILVRRPMPGFEPLGPRYATAFAVLAVALLAVLWSSAPLVRRIRRLTSAVRNSAADRYATPIAAQGRDELAELATAFNDAGREIRGHLQSLEQREQTLRAFLGNTTHDVMLPLTVMLGHLSRLREQVDAGGPGDRALVVAALDQAHYLASLMHNLGAAAKLDAGEPIVRRDRVDLTALVERVAARHAPVAQAKDIALEHAVPEAHLSVVGDVTLLEQAVSNLVHNAVRYNRSGGHVAVVLERRRAPDGFVLRVIDDGPGLAADELARLTERRFRGAAASAGHPEGQGLGLHIALTVAERHGFTLRFAPSEFGGLAAELQGLVAP